VAEGSTTPENFDPKQENKGLDGDANSAAAVIERDAQGHFIRGQSGNPTGRPRGSRNKDTVLVEQMFERFGGALANKAVNMALDGNMAATICDS
jgi:hypothetical protein